MPLDYTLLQATDSTCTCDTHKQDYIVYTCLHLFELNVHLYDLGLSFMPTEYEFVSFCGFAEHTGKLNEAFCDC